MFIDRGFYLFILTLEEETAASLLKKTCCDVFMLGCSFAFKTMSTLMV